MDVRVESVIFRPNQLHNAAHIGMVRFERIQVFFLLAFLQFLDVLLIVAIVIVSPRKALTTAVIQRQNVLLPVAMCAVTAAKARLLWFGGVHLVAGICVHLRVCHVMQVLQHQHRETP